MHLCRKDVQMALAFALSWMVTFWSDMGAEQFQRRFHWLDGKWRLYDKHALHSGMHTTAASLADWTDTIRFYIFAVQAFTIVMLLLPGPKAVTDAKPKITKAVSTLWAVGWLCQVAWQLISSSTAPFASQLAAVAACGAAAAFHAARQRSYGLTSVPAHVRELITNASAVPAAWLSVVALGAAVRALGGPVLEYAECTVTFIGVVVLVATSLGFAYARGDCWYAGAVAWCLWGQYTMQTYRAGRGLGSTPVIWASAGGAVLCAVAAVYALFRASEAASRETEREDEEADEDEKAALVKVADAAV